MEQENVFDDAEANYAMQQRLKMQFLETQKERLELLVSQLSQNLGLLRMTNEALAKNAPQQVNLKLNIHNAKLQKCYLRIMQENQSITTQEFLQRQIYAQEQMELREAITSYEDKILEMRRTIQLKQGFVQNLENNTKYHVQAQVNSASPHTITMLYYQELQEYKDCISNLTVENAKLKKENEAIKAEIVSVKNKSEMIQRLTKTRTSYYDFVQWCNESKRNKSESKVPVERSRSQIVLKLLPETKNVQQPVITNDNAKSARVSRINISADILVKKKLENDILHKKVIELREVARSQEQQLKKLKQSNLVYQKERKQFFDQLNYYKKRTQEMLKVLSKRKAIDRGSSRSVDKSQVEEMIRRTKMPAEITYVNDRKGLWQGFKASIQKPQENFFPELIPKRRPLSCVNDYIKFQTDQVDQYLTRKISFPPRQDALQNTGGNFSMMLDQYIQNSDKDPFEFSAIKPGERLSYAQMKEMKKNKNNIKKYGLTLIEEDIF